MYNYDDNITSQKRKTRNILVIIQLLLHINTKAKYISKWMYKRKVY